MSMSADPGLFEFREGNLPLLINVPHAGTYLPPDIATVMTTAARRTPDTDWHVHRLYGFAEALGASLLVATHSRYVVDLNRDPGDTPLYAGADNTELCPTRTFANAPIYRPGHVPTSSEIQARRARYWQPYHERLDAVLAGIRARHGRAVLLDAHSIRSEVPRFFTGRLPDLNLGTADGRSCSPQLEQTAEAVLARFPAYSRVVNGRFKGGYITRQYGRPQAGIEALQLEIAQSSYLDEAQPERWVPSAAAPLTELLKTLVRALAR